MNSRCKRHVRTALWAVLILAMVAAPVGASDLIKYALSDLSVWFLVDDAAVADWPTVYYLNEEYGCRVDVIEVVEAPAVRVHRMDISNRELYCWRTGATLGDSTQRRELVSRLTEERLPDVVVLAAGAKDSPLRPVWTTLQHAVPESALVAPAKFYDAVDPAHEPGAATDTVILNVRELYHRYQTRIDGELPHLLNDTHFRYRPLRLHSKYSLSWSNLAPGGPDIDLLSNLETLRLSRKIQSGTPEGPLRSTLLRQAGVFEKAFRAAHYLPEGRLRADSALIGYRALASLAEPTQTTVDHPGWNDLVSYLMPLMARAERAALDELGLNWDAHLDFRDTPHGSQGKYILTISIGGPRAAEVQRVAYRPVGDTLESVIDGDTHIVAPHQTFAREYLLPTLPTEVDSLDLQVDLMVGALPLSFHASASLRQPPPMSVGFEPGFHLVPPVSQIDIDRLVSPMALNAEITKPHDFAGKVHIQLTTPPGVFAGAYNQTLDLMPGQTLQRIRIPFTVSNLMELGTQLAVIKLVVDGQLATTDTAHLRIARCPVDETTAIGFLPDSSGCLEDILRMIGANHRPLTDRALHVADLGAYDIIIVGSGAHRRYQSLPRVRDRLEDFIRWGGSLIVLGQDADWPDRTVPFGLTPVRPSGRESQLDMPGARLLSKPFKIDADGLLGSGWPRHQSRPAVVHPSEVVVSDPGGGALLTVSRLGSGQMIYCGLPLTGMVARLNLEAVHLLANLLNY